MAEKLFTVVGTAINPKGELKMRWANDLVQRINILIKGNCEDINLHEMPKSMTKLDAAEWLRENTELTPDQDMVVTEVIAVKSKIEKRAKAKATMTENVKAGVKENKKTDPRVAEFIEKTTADMGNDQEKSKPATTTISTGAGTAKAEAH